MYAGAAKVYCPKQKSANRQANILEERLLKASNGKLVIRTTPAK